jgi:hypothetical protein
MSFPNPRDQADYFRFVDIGGHRIKATLVNIEGIKLEADWKEQRPTGNSGATNNFQGMKPPGPVKLTFRVGADVVGGLNVEHYDDLRALFEEMGPKAGANFGGTGTTQGSPGSAAYGKRYVQVSSPSSAQVQTSTEDLLRQATQALAALQSGQSTTSAAAASTTSSSASASKTTTPNPGPKPPTLSIKNGWVNYVGITQVSLKSWEGPKPDGEGGVIVVLELATQKDPTPAAVGKAAPKSPDQSGKQIAFGDIDGPAARAMLANQAAAAAGAE